MKHKRHTFRLCALVLWTCMAMQAAPIITNIAMVPNLTIQSDIGITNQIQYSTDPGRTDWTVLTNLLVTQSPYSFVDRNAPPAPSRFYRVLVLNHTNTPAPANMAFIPAGSFMMGDTFSEGDGWELPVHSVYVSAFYMDRYEVTKALWDEVYYWATNHGYSFEQTGSASISGKDYSKGLAHPITLIDWYNAVKWCNARSEMENRAPAYYTSAAQTDVYRGGYISVENEWVKWNAGYRLPTEAEWEKAARGGASGHRFPWATEPSWAISEFIRHSAANYNSANYLYNMSPTDGYHPNFNDDVMPYTNPVGYFAPNGYGLYDMAGNVLEWCWDWKGPYTSASQIDPRGPSAAPTGGRVHRGGSWYRNEYFCRSAARFSSGEGSVSISLGFRCVLPAPQP